MNMVKDSLVVIMVPNSDIMIMDSARVVITVVRKSAIKVMIWDNTVMARYWTVL